MNIHGKGLRKREGVNEVLSMVCDLYSISSMGVGGWDSVAESSLSILEGQRLPVISH